MSGSNATNTGERIFEVRLPASAASKLTAAAKATGQSLEVFVGVVLTRHAGDPYGLWADAAVAVNPTEIPGMQKSSLEFVEPDRHVLIAAASAGATVLSQGGDEAAAKAAVHELAQGLAESWGDETYEKMLAYTLDVAIWVWDGARVDVEARSAVSACGVVR